MKPYGVGLNGHANRCDCTACAQVRANRVAELMAEPQHVSPPASLQATVYVRPHFRRQPGHLRKYSNTAAAIREVLKARVAVSDGRAR